MSMVMHKFKIAGVFWILGMLFFAGCGDDEDEDHARLYHTEDCAPSLDPSKVNGLEYLGPVIVDQGVNFSVWSERATRIELLLFDDPESDQPTRRIPMTNLGHVWSVYVEGIGVGQHYGYVAWGPNWPFVDTWSPGSIDGFIVDVDEEGNRFNPNKLLFDPYSTALHRDHDWSKGSLASGFARTELTWDAAAKSVIIQSQYQWSASEADWREKRQNPDWEGHKSNDLIIYEVHLKGMTMDPASGVKHPGTYRGMGEMASYLEELGITAVELMPIMEKPLDGTYWGYNTLNYFAPELSFTAGDELSDPTDEFKWMVDQLHQHHIEVILDVVYNHTGEGGFWRKKVAYDDVILDPRMLGNFEEKEVASIYSYRGLDNAGYYLLADDKAYFWDQTGVGNQCRTNVDPMRRLIMDSLRYWVQEMHVDGFRFDLATVLGVRDEDPTYWDPENSVLKEIVDDPLLQKYNTRIIAEPWHLGQYRIGGFPVSTSGEVAWYEWNGKFRDLWRSFINSDDRGLNANDGGLDIGGILTGSSALFAWNGRKPYHSVNFVTAHDGFTLYDLFSYNEKQNLCGPLNPICCTDPTNAFCDANSGDDNNHSRDWGADNEAFKRQLIRNTFVFLLIAHGTPMILGGDEWMRTQLGNNNAYSTSADNEYNWFRWGLWKGDKAKVRMHDFVKKMIRLRKDYAYAFAPASYEERAPFAWKNPGNGDMNGGDWDGRSVMLHYYDTSWGPELVVLINMDPWNTVTFKLPEGRVWQRLVDTQMYFESEEYLGDKDETQSYNITLEHGEEIPGSEYGVPSRAIVILKAK